MIVGNVNADSQGVWCAMGNSMNHNSSMGMVHGGTEGVATQSGSGAGLWHITSSGKPGRCSAVKGHCPYGGGNDGMDNHYHSEAEAYRASEGKCRDGNQTMMMRKSGTTQSQPRGDDGGASSMYDEHGVDKAHAQYLRDTAFSDDTLTNAPLANIPGVPARLQPLAQDYEEASRSFADWSRPGTRVFLSEQGIDVDGLLARMERLDRPIQTTYMGLNPDGTDAIPPVGAANRQEALDALVTDYDRKLQEVKDTYEVMRKAFQADYKGAYIRDYSYPRLLVHWGRALADEKAYIESLGGVSSMEKPKSPDWKPSEQESLRRQWYYEATGKSTLPSQGAVPIYEGEMDKPYFAEKMAREVCMLQGRSRSDAKQMAMEAMETRDRAITRARAQGKNDWEVYVAGRDAYCDALMGMTYSAPLSEQQITMIDVETTGLEPSSFHIHDVGWCTMSLTDESESINDANTRRYGNGEELEATGNPTGFLTGITVDDLRGRVPLNRDPDAQAELLGVLTARPFMAHNARFEDGAFSANIRGYAEAKRAGKIRIIDSMVLCQRYDPTTGRGTRSLEAYAKRWGAISGDQGERHLGYEDAVVMGLAAGRNMRARFAEHNGVSHAGSYKAFDTGRQNGVSYDAAGNAVTEE